MTALRRLVRVLAGQVEPLLEPAHADGVVPVSRIAEVAELVDALASGASEHLARGGSSPLLGTKTSLNQIVMPFFVNQFH